jgi:hypothetical protein
VSPSGDELTKLLSADNLKGLTGSIEKLRLCKEEGGQWVIDTNRPALQAVLNRSQVKSAGWSGKELADHFGAAPYGWTLDAVRFLVAALQVAGNLKATHNAQSFVGTANPQVRPLFTNNSTFRATLFVAHAGKLKPEDVMQASQLFQKFAGKTVAGVQPGPLAREIRVVAVGVNAELNSASRALAPLQLPGIEALEQASEQVSTWQDNNDEEVVLAFKSSAEAVKEAWQKAKGIQETLASRSADLQRARKALSAEIWGQLLQEADLPAELTRGAGQRWTIGCRRPASTRSCLRSTSSPGSWRRPTRSGARQPSRPLLPRCSSGCSSWSRPLALRRWSRSGSGS